MEQNYKPHDATLFTSNSRHVWTVSLEGGGFGLRVCQATKRNQQLVSGMIGRQMDNGLGGGGGGQQQKDDQT